MMLSGDNLCYPNTDHITRATNLSPKLFSKTQQILHSMLETHRIYNLFTASCSKIPATCLSKDYMLEETDFNERNIMYLSLLQVQMTTLFCLIYFTNSKMGAHNKLQLKIKISPHVSKGAN